MRGMLAVLAAALLVGCGGGGGDSGGSADLPPPAPPSSSLSLSQNSVTANGATGSAAPASVHIKLTVSNAPSTMLASTVVLSGDSVAAASASWQSSSEGD